MMVEWLPPESATRCKPLPGKDMSKRVATSSNPGTIAAVASRTAASSIVPLPPAPGSAAAEPALMSEPITTTNSVSTVTGEVPDSSIAEPLG